jgi:rhodanese-related sulfurtransferase
MKNARLAIAEAIVIIVVAFVVAFAFNSRSATGINPFRQPKLVTGVHATMGPQEAAIGEITLDEARAFVSGGGKVVDARTKAQFDEGHIPGAINLDYYEFQKEIATVLPRLSKDEEIMVYCEGVDCEASELLAKELYSLGFTKLLLFKGGFEEWSAAGLQVEKGGQ